MSQVHHCLVIHGKFLLHQNLLYNKTIASSILKETSKRKTSPFQISNALRDHRWFQSVESFLFSSPLIQWCQKKDQLELGLSNPPMCFLLNIFFQTTDLIIGEKNVICKGKKAGAQIHAHSSQVVMAGSESRRLLCVKWFSRTVLCFFQWEFGDSHLQVVLFLVVAAWKFDSFLGYGHGRRHIASMIRLIPRG